ncbi:MAG: peptide chain release factor 3, partial [Pseudomonadota bacterium]
ISSDDRQALDAFMDKQRASIARDLDGDPVFLAENAFSLNYEAERAPGIVFDAIKDYQVSAKKAA